MCQTTGDQQPQYFAVGMEDSVQYKNFSTSEQTLTLSYSAQAQCVLMSVYLTFQSL